MQPHFFSFESSELKKNRSDTFSHCSSVQDRLATYGSEALDAAEHLGLILGSQKAADALLEHFGSLTVLAVFVVLSLKRNNGRKYLLLSTIRIIT